MKIYDNCDEVTSLRDVMVDMRDMGSNSRVHILIDDIKAVVSVDEITSEGEYVKEQLCFETCPKAGLRLWHLFEMTEADPDLMWTHRSRMDLIRLVKEAHKLAKLAASFCRY